MIYHINIFNKENNFFPIHLWKCYSLQFHIGRTYLNLQKLRNQTISVASVSNSPALGAVANLSSSARAPLSLQERSSYSSELFIKQCNCFNNARTVVIAISLWNKTQNWRRKTEKTHKICQQLFLLLAESFTTYTQTNIKVVPDLQLLLSTIINTIVSLWIASL